MHLDDWCPVLFHCWVISSGNKNALEATLWVVKMPIHHHKQIYSITLQVLRSKLNNCKKCLWNKGEKDQVIAWSKRWVNYPLGVEGFFYLGGFNSVSAGLLGKQRPGIRFCATKMQATGYIGYFVPFPKKKEKNIYMHWNKSQFLQS